jgi:hypothetical protein
MSVKAASPLGQSRRMWVAVIAALSTLTLVAGCGVPIKAAVGGSRLSGAISEPRSSSPTATAEPVAPSGGPFDDRISAVTWTDGPWPFTVPQGTLACTNLRGLQSQTLSFNGITYALNEVAKSGGLYPAIDSIWRANPDIPGSRINISEVIDYARILCGR